MSSIQLHKIISWCSKTNYLQARHFGALGQEVSFTGSLPSIVNDVVKALISPTAVAFPGRAPPTLMIYLPGKTYLSLYIYKGAMAIGSIFGYGGEQKNGWDEVKSEEVNEKEDHEDDEDFNTATILSSLSLDSKVILYVYGETEHSVIRAEKRLRAIIDTQFISEDVVDEKIVGLSDLTARELESLAKEHNVGIDIDRHPSIYTI